MASRFDVIPTFNPYIEDIPTDIFTQVGLVKQGEYAKGVERVQSYIDTLAGLDIAKQEDKNMLTEKLNHLAGDISRFSGEDFSNPLLQGRLTQMASGVYRDQGIQNAVLGTQQYRRKQSQIAEIRKSKPELYNPDNESYALMDIDDWLHDGKAGTQLVDTKSFYNYHDYSKEVRDAMANFKPTSVRTKLPNGEWMITDEDKSWNESELKEYLNAVLSDKAKQQMRIESTVAFRHRDLDLLGSYYTTLKGNKKKNTEQINILAAKATVMRDPRVSSEMQKQVENLKNQNLEFDNKISKIDSGDYNFFQANKEGIAQWLFQNAYIDQVANGFSHKDVTLEYSPNDVWNTKFVQSMENARLNARLAFDADENEKNRQNVLKAAKIRAGKGDDENALPNLLKSGANVGEDDKFNTSKDQFQAEKDNINKDRTSNYMFLREKLLAENGDLRRLRQDFVEKGGKDHTKNDPVVGAVMEYIRQEKAKPSGKRQLWFNEFVDRANALDVRQSVLDGKEQEIEDQVRSEYGNIYVNAQDAVKGIPEIKVPVYTSTKISPTGTTSITGVSGNINVSPDDVLRYLTGKLDPSKYGVIDKALKQVPGMGQRNALADYIDNIKAKVGGNQAVKNLNDAFAYRDNLYKQQLLNLGDWWTPVDKKDKKYEQVINYLQRQVGGDTDEFNIARVNQSTGEIQFKLSPRQKSTINVNLMESLGYTYDSVNDTYTMTNLDVYKRQGLNNLTPVERELMKALDVNVNIPQVGYYTPRSAYDPNGNGEYVQIVKDKAPDGSFRYLLRHENSKTTLDKQVFPDPISAITAAKALTEDKQQLANIIASYK